MPDLSPIEEDVLGGDEQKAPRASLKRRNIGPAQTAPAPVQAEPAPAASKRKRPASEVPEIELETRAIQLFSKRLGELSLGGKRRVLDYVRQIVNEAEMQNAKPMLQSYQGGTLNAAYQGLMGAAGNQP